MGRQCNTFINECYRLGNLGDFFLTYSEASRTFRELASGRIDYWLKKEAMIPERAGNWLSSLKRALALTSAAGDRLGLWRNWIWAQHSTKHLIVSAFRIKATDNTVLESIYAEMVSVLDRYSEQLRIEDKSEERSISLVEHRETGENFLLRKGKRNFLNIYRIDSINRDPKFVELVESWHLTGSQQVTICVPLSVGCANQCTMCDLGRYFAGDLSPTEIVNLLNTNLLPDVDIPIDNHLSKLTLYFLGGGDALLYTELVELISLTQNNFPEAKQIYSSIGVKQSRNYDKFLEAAAVRSNVGFQFSLCSIDDPMRSRFVRSGAKILTVKECVDWGGRFFERTGRKAYFSIFLVKGESATETAYKIRQLIDKDKAHITLTVLNPGHLEESKIGASLQEYGELLQILLNFGYEASISTNDQDEDNNISCGIMEQVVRDGNLKFGVRRNGVSSS